MEFQKFLESVDSPAPKAEYLTSIIEILATADIWDRKQLVADLATQQQMFAMVTKGMTSAGKIGFIKRAFELAGTLVSDPSNSSLQLAPTSLLQALRKDDKKVHVDMANELKDVSLDCLSASTLPKGAQVDALASEVERLKAKGVVAPFVHVELRKFLPSWCDELSSPGDSSDEEDQSKAVQDLARALGAKPKEKRRLSLLQWCLAFDKYAIAAAATKQLSFDAAMAHKEVCLQVASRAQLKHRRHILAVLYDDVCRKEWSELAYAGSLDVTKAAMKLDDNLLSRAETLHDQQLSKSKGKGKGKRNSWSGSSWDSSQPAYKRGRY